jgi:hypothetical protein
MLLLRNPIRGCQGPNWAVEPYDDDDDESHTMKHTVGFLWTSDQPVSETSTYTGQHNI